jgi:hypothetical protein
MRKNAGCEDRSRCRVVRGWIVSAIAVLSACGTLRPLRSDQDRWGRSRIYTRRFVSGKNLSLIALLASEAAAGAEVSCGGNGPADVFGCQPGFSGIASEPFTEKVIQRCMFGFGPAESTLDKGIVPAKGHVSHIFRVHCTCAPAGKTPISFPGHNHPTAFPRMSKLI